MKLGGGFGGGPIYKDVRGLGGAWWMGRPVFCSGRASQVGTVEHDQMTGGMPAACVGVGSAPM